MHLNPNKVLIRDRELEEDHRGGEDLLEIGLLGGDLSVGTKGNTAVYLEKEMT